MCRFCGNTQFPQSFEQKCTKYSYIHGNIYFSKGGCVSHSTLSAAEVRSLYQVTTWVSCKRLCFFNIWKVMTYWATFHDQMTLKHLDEIWTVGDWLNSGYMQYSRLHVLEPPSVMTSSKNSKIPLKWQFLALAIYVRQHLLPGFTSENKKLCMESWGI